MRIRILGAGIIGLACADELQRRGHDVSVVDPAPASGASWAAAGMLSPGGEAWHGEEELFRLGGDSAALWPEYAARLGVPLHTAGTLLVGCDAGDVQQLERQVSLLASHGVSAELLTGREVRALEPTLGPQVGGGVHLREERSVEPRTVLGALRQRVGEALLEGPSPVDPCDATVVATGAVLPEPFTHLVRRVRGEILRVRTDDPPAGTVRGLVHGEPVYVVPRPRPGGVLACDVVVGATAEEHDEAAVVTLGGVARILDAARVLMPGLDRAELVETLARDRSGTPDNLPLVGPSGVSGTTLAAGHYRHGVLLAPLTAQLVADHLETGHVEPTLDPRRFSLPPDHWPSRPLTDRWSRSPLTDRWSRSPLTDRWSSRSRSDRVETPDDPRS